jgi:Protein of unknown function (DUF4038)/Putative collagen-binding domain of a collagenase
VKTTIVRNHKSVCLRVLLGLVAALTATAAAQSTGPEAPRRSSYRPAYPLRLSANHRYLVDQSGRPFLMVGDTPQGLMGRLTEQDAEQYFADREAHGFNTMGWVDVACAGRDFPDDLDGSTPDGIRPFAAYVAGGTDYTHYDLTKPNEAYFTRLDHILQIAAAHDIYVFVDPMETIGWLPTLRNNGLKAAYAYGQYLGRRYKSFANVGWISGNDFNNWRVSTDDALAQAVAKGIKSEAPGQLQTVELNVNTSSSLDDPTWAPIISLNGTYTYSATYIQMLHSYNQKPVIPAYLLEAHYDLEQVGDPTDYGTPEVLRREEYWTMLSGGIGQFYGNRYTWSLTPGWQGYIDTPGVAQLDIWKDFFLSLPWQELVPDQKHETVTAGYGTFGNDDVHFDPKQLTARMDLKVSDSDYATAARTADGSYVVVYMPTAHTITVDMSRMRGSAVAEWFDPSNGEYEVISGSPLANSGTHEFVPPGTNSAGDSDWVLLLKASEAEKQ